MNPSSENGGQNGVYSTYNTGNDSGSKSRLIMIFSLVGVLIIASIIVIVVILTGRGSNNGSKNSVTDANYAPYTIYAKYLLNTSENTNAEITEYDVYSDYAVQIAFYDDNTEYFTQLNKLWNDFYEQFSRSDKYSETSKIAGDVSYQNQLMDFMTKYMASNKWSDDELLDIYLKNGLQNATTLVNENYNKMTNTIFAPGKTYAEALLNNSKLTLDVLSEYRSLGCIVDGAVDFDCVVKNADLLSIMKGKTIAEVDEDLPEETIESLIEFGFRINDDFRSLRNE